MMKTKRWLMRMKQRWGQNGDKDETIMRMKGKRSDNEKEESEWKQKEKGNKLTKDKP